MNENDENIDSLLDAAPDIEHLRLEISENGEVFYGIDGVTKGANNFFFVFFVSRERKRSRRNFFVFSKRFSSRQPSFLALLSNKR